MDGLNEIVFKLNEEKRRLTDILLELKVILPRINISAIEMVMILDGLRNAIMLLDTTLRRIKKIIRGIEPNIYLGICLRTEAQKK